MLKIKPLVWESKMEGKSNKWWVNTPLGHMSITYSNYMFSDNKYQSCSPFDPYGDGSPADYQDWDTLEEAKKYLTEKYESKVREFLDAVLDQTPSVEL